MSKTYKSKEEMIKAVEKAFEKEGYFEEFAGICLRTSEVMIDEQRTWEDEDKAKGIDFSTSQYWVTTDDGASPEPVESVSEFVEKYGIPYIY